MGFAIELEEVEDAIKNEILSIPVNRKKTIEDLKETLSKVSAKRRKAWREYGIAIQTNLNI